MFRTNIGEFEELILLLVGGMGENAYGVEVMREIKKQTGRNVNISAVHSALRRLEKKGFLKSKLKGATTERGGRRKRIFWLSHAGRLALDKTRELRSRLWEMMPKIAISRNG